MTQDDIDNSKRIIKESRLCSGSKTELIDIIQKIKTESRQQRKPQIEALAQSQWNRLTYLVMLMKSLKRSLCTFIFFLRVNIKLLLHQQNYFKFLLSLYNFLQLLYSANDCAHFSFKIKSTENKF